MIAFVNWLRQVFCRHDFKVEEINLTVTEYPEVDYMTFLVGPRPTLKRHRTVVYQRCKKCGFHTKHDKY